MPGIKRTSNIGSAILEDDDERDKQYCLHCIKTYGKYYELDDLPLLEDGTPQVDAEQFRFCYHCKRKIPIYEVPIEGEIFTDVDTIDSPFELGKVTVEPVKFKHPYQSLKKQTKPKDRVDKEIEIDLKSGGEITNYDRVDP